MLKFLINEESQHKNLMKKVENRGKHLLLLSKVSHFIKYVS